MNTYWRLLGSAALLSFSLLGAPLANLTALSGSAYFQNGSVSFSLSGISFDVEGGAPGLSGLPSWTVVPGLTLSQVQDDFQLASSRLPGQQHEQITINGVGNSGIWTRAPNLEANYGTVIPTTSNPTLTIPAALAGTLRGCIPFNGSGPGENLAPCIEPRDQPLPDIAVNLQGQFVLTFSGPDSNGLDQLLSAQFTGTAVPEPSTVGWMAVPLGVLAIAARRMRRCIG